MANNANQSKTYRIYLKSTKEWVEVPEEFYREQKSYWDAFRKKAQYHGQCICPKSKFWLCDGDCFNCEFRRAGDIKTGMSRAKLSHMMDAETWMDAHTAVDLGFADEILMRPGETPVENKADGPMLFSRAAVTNSLMDKLAAKCRIQQKPAVNERSVDTLMERLNLIRNHI